MSNSNLVKTASVIAVIFGLLGSVWAVDKVYLRRDIHELTTQEIRNDIAAVQKQIMIQQAYDEVFYWQKLVTMLQIECSRRPNDLRLKQKLDDASSRLLQAEKRLRELQGR